MWEGPWPSWCSMQFHPLCNWCRWISGSLTKHIGSESEPVESQHADELGEEIVQKLGQARRLIWRVGSLWWGERIIKLLHKPPLNKFGLSSSLLLHLRLGLSNNWSNLSFPCCWHWSGLFLLASGSAGRGTSSWGWSVLPPIKMTLLHLR